MGLSLFLDCGSGPLSSASWTITQPQLINRKDTLCIHGLLISMVGQLQSFPLPPQMLGSFSTAELEGSESNGHKNAIFIPFFSQTAASSHLALVICTAAQCNIHFLDAEHLPQVH